MLPLQIVLIISLLIIFYQDYKDRMVFWWLFPAVGIILSLIHSKNVGMQQFLIHISFSIGMTIVILAILVLYIKWRLGSLNFNKAIGTGDILILFALALGFPPISYITLLVFGLLFALLVHQVLQFLSKQTRDQTQNISKKTVPLAGYLALFFCGVLFVHWFGGYNNLYVI